MDIQSRVECVNYLTNYSVLPLLMRGPGWLYELGSWIT